MRMAWLPLPESPESLADDRGGVVGAEVGLVVASGAVGPPNRALGVGLRVIRTQLCPTVAQLPSEQRWVSAQPHWYPVLGAKSGRQIPYPVASQPWVPSSQAWGLGATVGISVEGTKVVGAEVVGFAEGFVVGVEVVGGGVGGLVGGGVGGNVVGGLVGGLVGGVGGGVGGGLVVGGLVVGEMVVGGLAGIVVGGLVGGLVGKSVVGGRAGGGVGGGVGGEPQVTVTVYVPDDDE